MPRSVLHIQPFWNAILLPLLPRTGAKQSRFAQRWFAQRSPSRCPCRGLSRAGRWNFLTLLFPDQTNPLRTQTPKSSHAGPSLWERSADGAIPVLGLGKLRQGGEEQLGPKAEGEVGKFSSLPSTYQVKSNNPQSCWDQNPPFLPQKRCLGQYSCAGGAVQPVQDMESDAHRDILYLWRKLGLFRGSPLSECLFLLPYSGYTLRGL